MTKSSILSSLEDLTNTSEIRHTGICLCGQIEYEVSGTPVFSGLCHCVNCKKWTGTSTGWYAFFSSEHFRLTKGTNNLRTFLDRDTDRDVTVYRNFCPNCGSTLAMDLPQRNGKAILVGTIDGDVSELWQPQLEVYCKDRSKWLPDLGIKQFCLSQFTSES